MLAESDGSDTRGRLSSLQLTEVMHPQATIKGSTLQIEDNGPVPWRACKILIRYLVNNSSARPSTLVVIEPGFRSWNRQRREAQPFRSEVDGFLPLSRHRSAVLRGEVKPHSNEVLERKMTLKFPSRTPSLLQDCTSLPVFSV